MNKKRGQATIFIILGLILVIFIGLIFYIKSDLVRQKIEELGFKSLVVPERVQTVVFYVDSCLENIGEEGLDIMGRQGGYIAVPNKLKYQYDRNLQVDEFTQNPYWLSIYGKTIPTTEIMEEQLKNYIEINFNKKCKLDSFEAIGYKFSIDDLDVDVQINKDNVNVKLNSKLDTKIGEDIFSLNNYIDGKIDVALGSIVDLGEKIVDKEMEDGSFEFNTLNLISTYTRDEDLPPMAGMDFDCSGNIWLKQSVKAKMKEILAVNIPYLKVENTEYNQRKSEFYNTMIWDVGVDYPELSVTFNYYKDWDLLVDVNPSSGEIIKTEPMKSGASLLPFFCLNYYNFRYDVKYPVLVTINDANGYSFSFPIQVYVKDNYKRERLSSDTSFEEVKVKSLFCDPEQRLSKEVGIFVADAVTNRELDGVSVIYECGAGDQCFIGETKNGWLKKKFPLCYNGIINIAKEGYLGYKERFTTSEDISKDINIGLEPFRTKIINGKVLEKGNIRDLKEEEELIIFIEKKGSTYEGYEYSVGASLTGNEDEIELVPGEYNVRMTLINNDDIKIPSQSFKTKGILFGIGSKTVTIPEQTISGLIVGGGNFIWNVDTDDLMKEKVTFFATSQGIPQSYSELDENFNNLDEITAKEPIWE